MDDKGGEMEKRKMYMKKYNIKNYLLIYLEIVVNCGTPDCIVDEND